MNRSSIVSFLLIHSAAAAFAPSGSNHRRKIMIRPAVMATTSFATTRRLCLIRSLSAPAAAASATDDNITPRFYSNASHGGIPIGAVQLLSGNIAPFRDLIHRTLQSSVPNKKHLCFRGVQPFIGPRNYPLANNFIMRGQQQQQQQQPRHKVEGKGRSSDSSSRLLLIHVPPAVATALDDGHPDLVEFLTINGGVYMPGLRRSTMHREATRRRRSERHAVEQISKCLQQHEQKNNESTNNSSTTFNDDHDVKLFVKPTTLENNPTFTFSELFAGIGGFRLGLEAIGGKCVFANEIDPCAASIYRRNFVSSTPSSTTTTSEYDDSNTLIEADILDLHAETDIPHNVDILTAGFPCQPFSVRGKQRGFNDERGQLYRELVRVLNASHPKSFIFENVAGLVSMGIAAEGGGGGRGRFSKAPLVHAGPVLQLILQAFEDCGYDVTWNVCNSRHYVAQQRERVFIVGVRKDLAIRKEQNFSWDWYHKMLLQGGSDSAAAPPPAGISTVVRDIMEPPNSSAVGE